MAYTTYKHGDDWGKVCLEDLGGLTPTHAHAHRETLGTKITSLPTSRTRSSKNLFNKCDSCLQNWDSWKTMGVLKRLERTIHVHVVVVVFVLKYGKTWENMTYPWRVFAALWPYGPWSSINGNLPHDELSKVLRLFYAVAIFIWKPIKRVPLWLIYG